MFVRRSNLFLPLWQRLRGELDRLLQKKIEDPEVDITAEGKGVVAAVVELLHSQNLQETSGYRRH